MWEDGQEYAWKNYELLSAQLKKCTVYSLSLITLIISNISRFTNCLLDIKRVHAFYSKTNQMHQCLKFILFWNDTLHVSDCHSVHHQDFTTVRTATGICQRDIADCLLASRQQYLFDKCLLLYVQSLTPDDGRKDHPKHVEYHSKIK